MLKELDPLVDQGDIHVQYNVGLMYIGGQRVPQHFVVLESSAICVEAAWASSHSGHLLYSSCVVHL
ncbi:MAG TPA: hypothetical protein VJM82_03715, partial [Nitrospiraceae bacterium]|nr:hypothetical protein [Nitrospiraceae bacterium]